MNFVVSIVIAIVAIAIVVAFLNRFYRKSKREKALIRTGAGGEKVALDGGFIALPFLHRVEEINMRTMRLSVKRTDDRSLMTEDRLRVDTELEFYVRVEPTKAGVAIAAQALGARAINPEELGSLFRGRFVDAIQAVIATKTMDQLHENRGQFVKTVGDSLGESLAQNGLRLESVSLTQLDQTSFAHLDENNAFNAVGMRRLAEIVSSNRKKRVAIDAEAEVAVRDTQLQSMKRKLDIDKEQQEAEINQVEKIEILKAESLATTESARQAAQRSAEKAQIERERDINISKIERDRELRESEAQALLVAESAKIQSQIEITKKRVEENTALAAAELSRQGIVEAQEKIQMAREQLAAERERQTALIRAKNDTDVSAEKTGSETSTIVDMATAEAKAAELRAEASRLEMAVTAEGKAAIIAAENELSPDVIRMKVDMHKMDRLPDLAEQMMKPTEKIDSIRINHISGLGIGGSGGQGSGNGSDGGPINNAVDGMLNLALQMPAVKKLGDSIGLNLDMGLQDKKDDDQSNDD